MIWMDTQARPHSTVRSALVDTSIFRWLFRFALCLSAAVMLYGLNEPLLDQHAFRQTQTAISAWRIGSTWNILDYETPVLGHPWSVPMEFPIYQTVTAVLAKVTPLPLEACGRLVSWLAMAAVLFPLRRILLHLQKDEGEALFLLSATLYLASPQYLFWGRSFMMETSALFLSMLFLWRAIRLVDSPTSWNLACCSLWGILAGLTKITTFPAFVAASLCYVFWKRRRDGMVTPCGILGLGFAVAVALGCFLAWNAHADALKASHPVAYMITSQSLHAWNFGTLEQRLSGQFWEWTVWRNMIPAILGGQSAVFLLVALTVSALFRTRFHLGLAAVLGLLFLLPMLVFTNLHLVHNYYQTANAIFLLAAAAVLLHSLLLQGKGLLAVAAMASILVGMSVEFMDAPLTSIRMAGSDRTLRIADVVRANTRRDSGLIVLGLDWSSEIHYYAQRKGLALPRDSGPHVARELAEEPSKLLGGLSVGALVVCPDRRVDAGALERLSEVILSRLPAMWSTKVEDCTVFCNGKARAERLYDSVR